MPPRSGPSSKRTAGSRNPRVAIAPALNPPQEGSRSDQGSRPRPQEGHTSGEEFDFGAAEDDVSVEPNLGTQSETQPTTKSTRGAQDIQLLFKLIETEELDGDGEKVEKRVCTWCG